MTSSTLRAEELPSLGAAYGPAHAVNDQARCTSNTNIPFKKLGDADKYRWPASTPVLLMSRLSLTLCSEHSR